MTIYEELQNTAFGDPIPSVPITFSSPVPPPPSFIPLVDAQRLFDLYTIHLEHTLDVNVQLLPALESPTSPSQLCRDHEHNDRAILEIVSLGGIFPVKLERVCLL